MDRHVRQSDRRSAQKNQLVNLKDDNRQHVAKWRLSPLGFTHEPDGSLTDGLAGLSPETAVAESVDAVGAKWQPETTITCSRSSLVKLMREP
jgi:hypothetical protein